MKTLYDTIAEFISGDWGEESRSPTSTQPAFCIRAADVVPIEANDFSTIPERFVSSSSFSQRQLREGDIVIEKSGGSPTQSTGRVVYISKPLLIAKQNVICSNFCTAIRLKPNWNPYFVYQYWRHIYNSGVFFNYEGKTSGLKNLQLEVALKSIPIPDIDLPTQLRIAGVMHKCIWTTHHCHYLSTNSNLERCLSISLSSFAPCALRSARRDLNPAIFSVNSAAVIGTYSILTSKY